ncbi:MAG: YiiX/YebB-like N1pC/P60 family cysteine hydrolase [Oligoflexia bacterium]|nr:YiiX/YebB-like N1pC/P60 family cysteine hydrolase [Oligoflexia bacterium]
MKVLKQQVQLFILVLSILLLTSQTFGALKPGDLIFLKMPCYVCSLIEKTTNSPFSHVGILDRDASGAWVVIMAIEPKVMAVSLQYLLSRINSQPVYMRMKSVNGQILAIKAVQNARRFIGTPYDSEFKLGISELYCSELVFYSFMNANNGNPVFLLRPMTFKPFTSEWTSVLRHPPPEGLLGISPGDLARSIYLQRVN